MTKERAGKDGVLGALATKFQAEKPSLAGSYTANLSRGGASLIETEASKLAFASISKRRLIFN